MKKTIEFPEGYEARIEGNKVILEPKEREDDRIRKALIQYIIFKGTGILGWRREELIAWLEKQGDKAFSVERVFAEAGIKPAYKDGNSWCVLIGDNIQEGICGFGETPKDAYINFLKELWGKAFEQKTSEWSEDDNAKIEFLCNLIKRNISEGTYSFGDGAKNGFVSKQEAIKMLQSLKSRVQPQPKSEWSEEDEYQINTILHGLDLKRELYKKEGNKVEEERYSIRYEWLKSLKSRYTWKPSEEQMAALKWQLDHPDLCSWRKGDLSSLYNDLKALCNK